MKKRGDDFFYRIVDVNFNRAREGLRVCEDISRFILKSRQLTSGLRSARHCLSRAFSEAEKREFTVSRDSARDLGRIFTASKVKRRDYCDVFAANMERAKESMRVLEEFFKLVDEKTAKQFMALRYKLYSIEKNAIKKIRVICSNR